MACGPKRLLPNNRESAKDCCICVFFFFQAEDGIRDLTVTGVQTCALPICPLAELSAVMKLVSETEKELSGKGRVLLRYSGTEPKIRLLIEGRESDKIDKQADRIADAIQSAIGAD